MIQFQLYIDIWKFNKDIEEFSVQNQGENMNIQVTWKRQHCLSDRDILIVILLSIDTF